MHMPKEMSKRFTIQKIGKCSLSQYIDSAKGIKKYYKTGPKESWKDGNNKTIKLAIWPMLQQLK